VKKLTPFNRNTRFSTTGGGEPQQATDRAPFQNNNSYRAMNIYNKKQTAPQVAKRPTEIFTSSYPSSANNETKN